MKIITIAISLILLSSILSVEPAKNSTNTTEKNETIVTYYEPVYYIMDEYWYETEPIEYIYVPTLVPTYDYIVDTFEPVIDQYFRKQSDNTQKEKSKEEIEKEVKSLKREVFGNETASTAKIRKEHKAYDPKWLLAQMKISRVLFLEDQIKKSENKNRKENETKNEAE